jgi:hypothetical protein
LSSLYISRTFENISPPQSNTPTTHFNLPHHTDRHLPPLSLAFQLSHKFTRGQRTAVAFRSLLASSLIGATVSPSSTQTLQSQLSEGDWYSVRVSGQIEEA